MLVALGIEEHDATIVQVEGGASARIMFNSVPGLPVAPDALDNDDGLQIAVVIELFKLCMLLYLNTSQFYLER